MRPIDHFFSGLDRFRVQDEQGFAHLAGEFSSLVGPLIGAEAAADMFDRMRERLTAAGTQSVQKFGALAAFFLGEYENDTMNLDEADWEDIRETLEELSGEMDLTTLTALMQELLSRGKI
jgi:hypothetical protein